MTPPFATNSAGRARLRTVLPDLFLGFHPPGAKNSITDVPGVLVSTRSIRRPLGHDPARPQSAINTGVTVVLPRREWFTAGCHAGYHRFNGSGEMTGSHWLDETGLLHSPIVLTNSFAVGPAYSGVYRHAVREHGDHDASGSGSGALANWFLLPVVAETYDGFMSDIGAMPVTEGFVVAAIDAASDAPVAEGNTGGGTGMLCQGFKAGTGSSSRVVEANVRGTPARFTVGVLAQVNFGKPNDLRVGDVPVGRILAHEAGVDLKQSRTTTYTQVDPNNTTTTEETTDAAADPTPPPRDGSIIVVIATDAPLHPTQLKRLAQRATVGVARTGGFGSNSSGDIFVAFSTAARIPREPPLNPGVDAADARFVASVADPFDAVQDPTINGVFEGVVEATAEAVWNSMCMAEDMVGPGGRGVKAIDLQRLREIVLKYGAGV